MTPVPGARSVVVVGGGVAGLACGRKLRALGADAVILEAADRAGGVVRTEALDGCPVEVGPQTCIAEPRLRALAEELGLKLVLPPKRERARFLVRGGKLVSPMRALSLGGMARALVGAFRKGAPPGEDETVAAYARRRFGEEAARRVFDPLVSGIFAGDPARLSYASALARFGKRRGTTASFEGGMGALPAALARALGPALRLGAKAREIARAPAGEAGWVVRLDGAEPVCADALVLACPADVAAALLAPLDAALADELRAIRYQPITAVSLLYEASAFPAGPPRGFGFLAPSEEGLPILGCLFCPAPEGRVLLRVMMRGTPADAQPAARAAVEPLLGAAAAPLGSRIHAHTRGIPQYEVGHARRLRAIDERLRALPGVRLAGNAYRGVAVPDVIEDAERVAEEVLAAGLAGAIR